MEQIRIEGYSNSLGKVLEILSGLEFLGWGEGGAGSTETVWIVYENSLSSI